MSPFTSEVAAARAAQQTWSRRSVRNRLRPIRRLRALLAERADALIVAVNAEIGRPAVEVIGSELLPTAAALKYLEQEARRILAPRTIGARLRPTWLMGCRDAVHRRPWGVVGIIGTWNYPIFLNAVQAAQAITAGNAVMWKPSENAPRTADLTHELFLEAGFPADLFQKLPAMREAGPQLAEAEVDHIVFTGSDVVGRKLAAKLGERLVPSTLELSGCDAMFVLADADVPMAAKAAWFGMTLNRGQTCIAVRRIFVERARYGEFVAALRPFFDKGLPMKLVSPGQLDSARRLIGDALKRGASLVSAQPDALASEDPGSRLTMQPTLLLDVATGSLICNEASFAPIAAAIPFDAIDEAISGANQSPFALAASIFTANPETAKGLAAQIPAGHVSINDVLAPTAHPATPFGGRGASGWGMTQGEEGLLAMTIPQTITVRKGTFRPHFDEAASPDPATEELLRGLLRWTHARGLGEKFRGLWQMVRGIRNQGTGVRKQDTTRNQAE